MTLLYIDCCISLNARSRTRLLAETFLDAWRERHPQDTVEIVDLKTIELPALTHARLAAREALLEEGRTDDPSFALARQFAAAERIVVAAPYWDLSYPAQLRLYIEHISARNLTFGYNEQGRSVGLCRAEKLLFLTTAGGPLENANHGGDHLQALCKLYGVGSYACLGAEMQDVQEIDHESILQTALQEAKDLARTF